MIPETYHLSDSVTLRAVITDKFKSETISFSLVFPADRVRSPVRTLLFALLKRGTERYPTLAAINRRLDELYAAGVDICNERRGDKQLLGFAAEMLADSYTAEGDGVLEGTVELLADMLFRPRLEKGIFLPAYVENEKQNLCDMIKTALNEPRSYAATRCREIMCADERYGISFVGTEERVRGITDAELMEEYARVLAESALDVFYVGSTPIEKVGEVVMRHFGAFHGMGYRYEPSRCAEAPALPREVREEAAVAQGKLVMGFRTKVCVTDPDFYAMLLLNEILGGCPSSKLFTHVREELGLCYYCSSSYNSVKGILTVSCGMDNDKRDTVVREVCEQLAGIARGEITDRELDGATRSLIHSYRAAEDSPSIVEDYFYGRILAGVASPDSFAEAVEHLARLTREEVRRVAEGLRLDTVYFLYGTLPGEGADEDE